VGAKFITFGATTKYPYKQTGEPRQNVMWTFLRRFVQWESLSRKWKQKEKNKKFVNRISDPWQTCEMLRMFCLVSWKGTCSFIIVWYKVTLLVQLQELGKYVESTYLSRKVRKLMNCYIKALTRNFLFLFSYPTRYRTLEQHCFKIFVTF